MSRRPTAVADPLEPSRHEQLSTSTTSLAVASAPQAAFEVTTLADVVDAADGVLSLREAITAANATAGADSIGFANSIRGGTITLTQGPLVVTDELVIDGDPLDGGPAGITVDGGAFGSNFAPGYAGAGFRPFTIESVAARIEDLTVQGGYYTGIRATDADLTLHRVTVKETNGSSPDGIGVDVSGGRLALIETSVGNTFAPEFVVGVRVDQAYVTITKSQITGNASDPGYGVLGSGTLRIDDSIIANNGGFGGGTGVDWDGSLIIAGSTLVGNGASDVSTAEGKGRAVAAAGQLTIINSTIADTRVSSTTAAIELADGTANIVNTTITGSAVNGPFPGLTAPGIGLLVADGADVRLNNSIIDDTVVGPITSNGANTFRDGAVDGAAATDRLDVTAQELFMTTAEIGTSDVWAGVLADNGGPTETVALRDDPTNPARNAADATDAPPTDQRGVVRDATPDVGAFEVRLPTDFDRGLIVTSLVDEVDTNGSVSLREALLTAEEQPGADSITFAPTLADGRLLLTGGSLFVDHDVTVDASTLSAPLVIDAGGSDRGFDIFEADVTLRGFGIENGLGLGIDSRRFFDFPGGGAVKAHRATLELDGMALRNNFGDYGGAIFAPFGSDITITDSYIAHNSGNRGGILVSGSSISIVDSVFSDNSHILMASRSPTTIARSSFIENGGASGTGIYLNNGTPFSITDSLFSENTPGLATIFANSEANGSIVNSTFISNAGGILGAAGASIDVVNVTMTGNTLPSSLIVGQTAGLWVFDERGPDFVEEASIVVVNSAIVGNIRPDGISDISGNVESRGGNLFSQAVFPAADDSDQLGVSADRVFAETAEIGTSGVFAGVLADNGGPTETVALLDDPANPALDRADPAAAPATDQRGLFRDATPDIGAFEQGGTSEPPPVPLPALGEKAPLANAEIRGAPRDNFSIGAAGDAEIGFVDEVGAFQSSLGVYLIGPDGEIRGVEWAFERIEHALPSDDASATARPAGGPLSPGDSVILSDLFDPAEFSPGTEFGLFLAADAWARNPESVFEGGTLEFRSNGDPANVTDTTPQLFHIAADGTERLVMGDILHTVDAGSPNPLSNTLNPGGTGQVTSGILDGDFVVAFEDKPLSANSDRDFNDALFSVDVTPAPAGVAELDPLLASPVPG